MTIRILTDGRAGNLTQAMGLGEALARRTGADLAHGTVKLRAGLSRLPNELLWRLPGKLLMLPDTQPADLVIGAGRLGNLAAARMSSPRRVAILRPQLPRSAFDAVILPEHDGKKGANVISTLGSMNRLTPERIAQAGTALALSPSPHPVLACLIGGPSRSARFEEPEVETLLHDIALFADWHIRVTTSRRTSIGVLERLARLPVEFLPWPGPDGDMNPYPGLLADAAAILVTEDSVNMASEAARTGAPVFVSGNGRVDAKFHAFHESLRARGITRPASEGPAVWAYDALCEADRVADMLMAQFGWSA